MGKSREFIISYEGKEHSIVAMNFYSACRNVILKECGAGVKFYICRFYSYKDRDNKRIENYLLTTSIGSVNVWLKSRYTWLDLVERRYGWFIAGDTHLTYEDIIQNIQSTVGEPSIVNIVEQGKIYYKYKYGFDIIALKS